jgi:hypothetical protein
MSEKIIRLFVLRADLKDWEGRPVEWKSGIYRREFQVLRLTGPRPLSKMTLSFLSSY